MQRTVDTNAGRIRGNEENGVVIYKGIPYAKPPVGDLRWRAPVKADAWTGIFDAGNFPNRALQPDWDMGETFYKKEFYSDPVYGTPVSEDCLYLNIWTPAKTDGTLLPVAFFIHGGAFDHGTGHEVEFRSCEYAKRGVILVTINYRLGLAGFMAHPNLQKEDPEACGNYGLLDQVMALQWVRENIEAFGGDPSNITLFGQSAGAASVYALLHLARTRGMAAKAIIQSVGGYPAAFGKGCSLEEAFEIGEEAMRGLGCTDIARMRNISDRKLLEIQQTIIDERKSRILKFQPCINGKLLTHDLDTLLKQGNMSEIPVMIGSTLNDLTVTEEELKAGRSRMEESCIQLSLMREKLGMSAAYVYLFGRKLPGDESGAFHSSELWYMFGTLKTCWRPMAQADMLLSERMLECWTEFMRSGRPDTGKNWRPCTQKDPFVMKFDI